MLRRTTAASTFDRHRSRMVDVTDAHKVGRETMKQAPVMKKLLLVHFFSTAEVFRTQSA